MFTEEFFALYKRYELAVHGKERDPAQVKRFLCNSPVYDDELELDFAHSQSKCTSRRLDKDRHVF